MVSPILFLLAACFGVAVLILLLVFVLVPLCKGIGYLITHIFSFIGGMLSDTLRFVGAILALIVLAPLAPLNVVIGRWSAAQHFVNSVKRECKVAGGCLYRIGLQHPLRLLFLGRLLEGLEQRVPEAMAGAPTRDKPNRKRAGQFDGYRIVGSLRGGGSGGKLYIAEPDEDLRIGPKAMPERVVIKSFALAEGSSLPQIVRESRALEAARQLGLVLDHSMSDQHFYYVMPYHPGDHLGIITRQLHAEAGEKGLSKRQLTKVMGYVSDLLATLSTYHNGGLWHKDVKPENVIVHDERAHVVDLGLVTPLRSAMTLTTHGTEYFRDPEMVRQALRGVKVHQIDCTRFDLYAAAAVLYFMLENTFPAHGGLSKFHRESPEALRWIVRRGMSEYNKRYASAEEMLADLAVVLESRDAFAVKPADLPSMGGARVPLPEMPEDTLYAGVDQDVAPHHEFVEASVDADDRRGPAVAAVAAGAAAAGAVGQAMAGAIARSRPRLSVTNWWTGAYRIDDDGLRSVGAHAHADPMPPMAAPPAPPIRSKVTPRSARAAARDQVRAARGRAHDMRRRVLTNRKSMRAGAEKQPGFGLVLVTLIVIGGLFAAGALIVSGTSRSRQHRQDYSAAHHQGFLEVMEKPVGEKMAVLLINEHPQSDDPAVEREVDRIVQQYNRNGYFVVETDPEANEPVVDAFQVYKDDPHGVGDAMLEDALEVRNLFGVLRVYRSEEIGKPEERVRSVFVHSTRQGRDERVYVSDDMIRQMVEAAPTAEPLLLINDHPAKFSEEVDSSIEAFIASYTDRGWRLESSTELEAQVRAYLPSAGMTLNRIMEQQLEQFLTARGYAGVFRVSQAAGEGRPEDRIEAHKLVFMLDDVTSNADAGSSVRLDSDGATVESGGSGAAVNLQGSDNRP